MQDNALGLPTAEKESEREFRSPLRFRSVDTTVVKFPRVEIERMAAPTRLVRRVCNGSFQYFGARSAYVCMFRRRSRVLEQPWMVDGYCNQTGATSLWLARRLSISTSLRYSALVDASEGPMAAYQKLCKLGQLKHGDLSQEKLVAALDKLFQYLSQRREPRWLEEWFNRTFWKQQKNQNSPRGLYIYGGVGRGKTVLMDLFYEKVNLSKKRRMHFHVFMLDIHGRLHKISMEQPNKSSLDFIKVVAEQIIAEVLLLCLDEVEVLQRFRYCCRKIDELKADVADALILRRLFALLWSWGVVVVATSNTRPDQLYRGGLNRPLFEPFIKQLQEHCCVYSLDEGLSLDYRRGLSKLDQLYLYPLVGSNDELLHEGFMTLTGWDSGSIIEVPVMMGRHLKILAAKGVARTSFSVLCGGAYGAADYIAIAQSFQALFLERIPWLGDPALENEARRFITLIDVLYEANVLFICSAAVSVDELLLETPELSENALDELQQDNEESLHVVGKGGSSGRSTLMIGEMEWSATGRLGASLAKVLGSTSFTRAASARTISRLFEMQSPAYLSRTGTLGAVILSKVENVD